MVLWCIFGVLLNSMFIGRLIGVLVGMLFMVVLQVIIRCFLVVVMLMVVNGQCLCVYSVVNLVRCVCGMLSMQCFCDLLYYSCIGDSDGLLVGILFRLIMLFMFELCSSLGIVLERLLVLMLWNQWIGLFRFSVMQWLIIFWQWCFIFGLLCCMLVKLRFLVFLFEVIELVVLLFRLISIVGLLSMIIVLFGCSLSFLIWIWLMVLRLFVSMIGLLQVWVRFLFLGSLKLWKQLSRLGWLNLLLNVVLLSGLFSMMFSVGVMCGFSVCGVFYGCGRVGMCRCEIEKLVRLVLGLLLWLVVFLLWILLSVLVDVFGKGVIVVGWLCVFILMQNVELIIVLLWYLFVVGFGWQCVVGKLVIIVVLLLYVFNVCCGVCWWVFLIMWNSEWGWLVLLMVQLVLKILCWQCFELVCVNIISFMFDGLWLSVLKCLCRQLILFWVIVSLRWWLVVFRLFSVMCFSLFWVGVVNSVWV